MMSLPDIILLAALGAASVASALIHDVWTTKATLQEKNTKSAGYLPPNVSVVGLVVPVCERASFVLFNRGPGNLWSGQGLRERLEHPAGKGPRAGLKARAEELLGERP